MIISQIVCVMLHDNRRCIDLTSLIVSVNVDHGWSWFDILNGFSSSDQDISRSHDDW
jgi:hypothetical protein